LAPFLEEALIKYRVLVEIEYFIALCEVPLPQLSGDFLIVYNIYKTSLLKMRFGSKKQKNQPRCKAVEYFIKDALKN
jgi:adenylosuccinate lyase